MTKPMDANVYLYGCSVIAPGSANLSEFLANVRAGRQVLAPAAAPFNQFLVGNPKFDFMRYESWFHSRGKGPKFHLLKDKSGTNAQLAVGCVLDALEANPGLEEALVRSDERVLTIVASGLGDVAASFTAHKELDKSLRDWYRFWAARENNPALDQYLKNPGGEDIPVRNPDHASDPFEHYDTLLKWNEYWTLRNPRLDEMLARLAEVEARHIGDDIEHDKLSFLRNKAKARREVYGAWGAPVPPWESVNPNFLFNIANAPAAQVSIALGLHGEAFGAAAACSSFGHALHQALKAIRNGEVDAAIVGAVDGPPTHEALAAFHTGKLARFGTEKSEPLCDMGGIHISGGACVWIVGNKEFGAAAGLKHLGVEILGTGISSDAEHIITPSREGPKLAIRRALGEGQATADEIVAWDMHATGTPGDWSELQLVDTILPRSSVLSARKGMFGHGMAASGGWELTAATLGVLRGRHGSYTLPPSGIRRSRIHPQVTQSGRTFVLDEPALVEVGDRRMVIGKLSLGIGGITSCTIVQLSPEEKPESNQ